MLIKFFNDDFFPTYYEHRLNELDGKKSFVCLGDDCPLCEIGDEPKSTALINVTNPPSPGGGSS